MLAGANLDNSSRNDRARIINRQKCILLSPIKNDSKLY